MTSVDDDRKIEHAKYVRAYGGKYGMGTARKNCAVEDLTGIPSRGDYLDVGCGRGEMLTLAHHLKFKSRKGVEMVPDLIDGELVVRGEAHDLPFDDKSFDVVSMFDVIEHLLPDDTIPALCELGRVARGHILLTANDKDSWLGGPGGIQLHINKRPYPEWDDIFRRFFIGCSVAWLPHASKGNISETWRIDL